MPTTIYTEKEYGAISDKYDATMNMLDAIFKSYSDEHKKRFYKLSDERVHYPFIPQSSGLIVQYFTFLNDYIKEIDEFDSNGVSRHLKFLDVGCGVGNVVLYAHNLFRWPSLAYGIERDKKLSMIARQFINPGYDNYIFHMDAFKFKNYNKFDIIYYYCPIDNVELQKKLELLIEKEMKVGAYLIPFLKQDKTFTTNGVFKRIDKDYDIFEKMK